MSGKRRIRAAVRKVLRKNPTAPATIVGRRAYLASRRHDGHRIPNPFPALAVRARKAKARAKAREARKAA